MPGAGPGGTAQKMYFIGPPGWCSGLRHCIAVLDVPPVTLGSSPGSVAAARYREAHGASRTIGLALSGLGRVLPAGISLSHRALATPVAGRAQCTLTRSLGVRCFLRHIGAAGFRVKQALCQEAVCGWVVFRGMHGSRPSPLLSLYWSCRDETRLTTNWIP